MYELRDNTGEIIATGETIALDNVIRKRAGYYARERKKWMRECDEIRDDGEDKIMKAFCRRHDKLMAQACTQEVADE